MEITHAQLVIWRNKKVVFKSKPVDFSKTRLIAFDDLPEGFLKEGDEFLIKGLTKKMMKLGKVVKNG